MRKVLITLMATALSVGGAVGFANADPGPNGSNHHGLCTAYFNGQKNGHGKNGNNPPPFEALEAAAESSDGDSIQEQVYNWCLENSPREIGGNPEHGRYPELFEDEDEG